MVSIVRLVLSLIISTFLFQSLSSRSQTIPLFERYPLLVKKMSCVDLGGLPTPLKKLKRLGKQLNHHHLYLKNDGEIGNKTRKLSMYLADAKKGGFKGVVTRGYAGSNHTSTTAYYAKKVGLECMCLHVHQQPTQYARRNLARASLSGATQHIFETNPQMAAFFEEKTKEGFYPIVTGGSSALGTLGFVNAAFELKKQIEEGKMPEPDYIYVGISTCGTTAGLALGLRLAGLKSQLVPICIRPLNALGHEKTLCALFNNTLKLLQKADDTIVCAPLTLGEIPLNTRFAGQGYALISPEVHSAIALLDHYEHIKTDGTYAGKALAAFMDAAQREEMKDKVLLFWNTFYAGSAGGAVKKIDYKNLPEGYHRYFNNDELLQELDQGY